MRSIKQKTILIFIFFIGIHPLFCQENESDYGKIKTVVIDAGHGGKDPGTHGAIVNEKTVVLSIALKLGDFIKKKYPEINVIYTRDDDTFISLDGRAKIANDNKADLFISIHANSAAASAYGTETYALGLHRTKSQEAVAKRENSTILYEKDGEEKLDNFELSPDAIIARQLQLSVYLDHSIHLASKVQSQFGEIGRHDRGVKQAGFFVLYQVTMPSILIEVGFLTNKNEEHFLAQEVNQLKMANSIFKGFQEYKANFEGVNELVENGEGYKTSLEAMKEKIAEEKEVEEKEDAVYFKVQIETSRKRLSLNDERFQNVSVEEYQQDGLYKYTTGVFENDFDSANAYKKEMRTFGFEHAFVVGFYGGERIAISKAIELATE